MDIFCCLARGTSKQTQCKSLPQSAAKEKAAETGISRAFYVNVRWLRRPGPWPGAEAVTSAICADSGVACA